MTKNNDIEKLKKDIIELHISHIIDNKEYILKFESMIINLTELMKTTNKETEQTKNDLLLFMASLSKIAEDILKDKNKKLTEKDHKICIDS